MNIADKVSERVYASFSRWIDEHEDDIDEMIDDAIGELNNSDIREAVRDYVINQVDYELDNINYSDIIAEVM